MALKKYQEEEWIYLNEQEALDRARSGILAFTLATKDDYEVNWHHREMCKALNRFIRREVRFLMVFMPPRNGKSELTSRRLPALIHGLYPDDHIMTGSYNGALSSDMCKDVQRIMDSPDYQRIFPETKIMPVNQKGFARNATEHQIVGIGPDGTQYPRGFYRSGGVGGSYTGRGANWILIDDPFKNQEEADSKTYREKVWSWYQSSLYTRLEKEGSILITMTRWHEDDLAGRLLSRSKADPEADQFEVVCFPAIKETDDNPIDPRNIGETLWPNKYDLKRMHKIKKSVGTRVWTALYQQRPTALEGGIVKRSWLRFWNKDQLPKAKFWDEVIQSWDLAFKDGEGSYVVGGVWARQGADCYLIDQIRDRLDFTDTCNAIRMLSSKHPNANVKLVEDAANGPAVIASLKHEIPGIVPVRADRSKVSRLHAVSPMFESGNVYLPDPSIHPWVDDYIEELVTFPNGTNDDQVDQTTQALNRFRGDGADFLAMMSGL